MPVFTATLFAFVRCHFMAFALFSAWHIVMIKVLFTGGKNTKNWFVVKPKPNFFSEVVLSCIV
jgi:hypothetical protein